MKKITLKCLQIIMIIGLFNIQLNAQEIIRGPYLQQGSPTSIIIKWRTDVAENSRVQFGNSTDNLIHTAQDAAVTTEHEVLISGLNSDTKYYYKVGSQSNLYDGRLNQFFKTAPNYESQEAFRTWILGDPGTQNDRQRAVRDGFLTFSNNTSPDLMLLLGDNAYDYGTDEQYQAALFENMYENILVNTHLWSSTGNHDLLYGYEDIYYSIFSFPTNGEMRGTPSGKEGYYSFDYANVHFVTIESSDEDKSSNGVMANWLRQDLQNTNQDWIVAYFHHPMYSNGHDTDDEGDLVELRESFAPILEEYGVDLVVYGHSHRYERTGLIKGHYGLSNTWNPNTMAIDDGMGQENNGGAYNKTTKDGTVYVTTGNAGKRGSTSEGKPVHKFVYSSLGSGVLDIKGKRLDYKQLDRDGAVIDYFTIRKDNFTDPDPDPSIQTITLSIDNGNDDVEEGPNGNLNLNSSDLELVYDHSSLQVVGLRFNSVELPKNATIESAYIQFTADESNSTDSELEISLHNHANSPAFSTSNLVSTRSSFSEKIVWTPGAWSSDQASSDQKTPDLKQMIQLLIDRNDWVSGNSLSFIIRGKGSSLTDTNAKRVADSYEGDATKAAKLTVTYKTGSDPDPVSYCSSNSNNTTYEYIQRVQIQNIDNPSEASTNGYSDYTDLQITLSTENTITITPNWPRGTSYPEGYSVWIDYNRDGDFNDNNEQVFSQEATKNTPVSGTFNIPQGAGTGATRMRVSMEYKSIPDSCDDIGYGEVEDYTVIISGDGKSLSFPSFQNTMIISPNPVKGDTSIRISFSNAKKKNHTYTIINLLGQEVMSGTLNTEQIIPIHSLQKGMYIIELKNSGASSKNSFTKRFIIE
ncbi:GEVED domain-containing protein [Aquimarina sp. 2201CG5-10]|uniref:GEVED domain-containing protein n=1 Tax=Aquimarina callyspongiae TaxID=3098150 RepID=UPI002AB4D7A3|nr:GEVED domain-containing protein [Aquimarina sp. 2201CG5-10]MDY8137851.1 GEVED domain-containing protein [Aquimarina sp. 2201CG5-10]